MYIPNQIWRSSLLAAAANSGFSPRQQPNLSIWVTAKNLNSITQDGSNLVSQWADLSGNSNHFTQSTDAQKPKYIARAINSLPALQGEANATPINMSATDAASMDYTTFHAFCVLQRVSNPAGNEHIFGKWNGGSNLREHRLIIDNANSDFWTSQCSTNGTAVVNGASSTTLSTGTPAILELSFDGTNTVIYQNGVQINSQALGGSMNAGTSSYFLFSQDANGSPYFGYIGEFLFYTAVRTAGQRAQNLSYLSQGWGISI